MSLLVLIHQRIPDRWGIVGSLMPTPVSRRQPCRKNNNAQKVHSTSQWPGLSECVNQTLMDSATKQHAYNNFVQAHYDLSVQQLNILQKRTMSQKE